MEDFEEPVQLVVRFREPKHKGQLKECTVTLLPSALQQAKDGELYQELSKRDTYLAAIIGLTSHPGVRLALFSASAVTNGGWKASKDPDKLAEMTSLARLKCGEYCVLATSSAVDRTACEFVSTHAMLSLDHRVEMWLAPLCPNDETCRKGGSDGQAKYGNKAGEQLQLTHCAACTKRGEGATAGGKRRRRCADDTDTMTSAAAVSVSSQWAAPSPALAYCDPCSWCLPKKAESSRSGKKSG